LREAEESTGINAVVDVEGLQKRLADARISFPPRDSDGRIPLAGRRTSPLPMGEMTTQPVAHSNWVRRTRRSSWVVRGAVLAAALAGVGIAALIFRPGKALDTARSRPTAELATLAAPQPSTTAEPVVVQPADLPQEVPTPRATASAPTPPVRVMKKAVLKTSHTQANCVPPYVLDAQGRKRFKPECF
jgi:serine/threonine-protein kinase